MYTGIIQACVPVVAVQKKNGLTHFAVCFPPNLLYQLDHGASISINGVCLTVVDNQTDQVWFDVIDETLKKTTLSDIAIGQKVNVERSAKEYAEIGGHAISGHVHGTATIINIDNPENNHVVTFQIPHRLFKFIFGKGFVALDGASLTVVDPHIQNNTFSVWFIPETLSRTTFGFKTVGDIVNVEVEQTTRVIVETIERIIPKFINQQKSSHI